MSLTLWYEGQARDLSARAPDGSFAGLARLLWLEGPLPPRPLCGGLGRCGRCRVRFLSTPPAPAPSERRILSAEDLEAGFRLACLHRAGDGMIIEVEPDPQPGAQTKARAAPSPSSSPVPASRAARKSKPGDSQPPRAGLHLAVDFGTTTVAWRAEDDSGAILAAGESPNPQRAAGADVMSRLAEAATPDGTRRMSRLALEFLAGIVDGVAENFGQVRDICLAANPAMTALALGRDSSGLRAAPYRLDDGGNREEHVHSLPPLWIPPQLGPFVGGDISAGLATVLDEERPFLLADMGTNGEFVLMPASGPSPDPSRHERPPLLAASVPLGPALEGVGLRCGGPAGPGGVTAFHAGPQGLTAMTLNGDAPRHICGTGYLSLIRLLLQLGLLDAGGGFCSGTPASPGPLEFLRARLAASLRPDSSPDSSGELVLPLPGGLFLSAGDVEAVLQVRAAFSLAVERLLAEAGLTPARLQHIYLAGALGRHAPLDALEDLGFVPAGAAGRTLALGNTALEGAALLLRGPGRNALRQRLSQSVAPCRVLDLVSDAGFHQDFIRHMRFGDTQRTV
ncbi:MAG: DUF4445 domain-containing protein [Desulfovibrionaceae bacterium]|nr:DUF4445 domain-containing protein [Desulfovibrionaceae bacterium]